jgi:N-hydroxyarylamine O-acetyltransferase
MPDTMHLTRTRDRLLRRIGLLEVPSADAAGLATVHRAFVSSVPFEDLTVQLGESRPLDRDALVERVLDGGRGGYCFEVNTVLHTLLVSLGFEVERRQGIVGPRSQHAAGEPTNHLTLVVETEAGPHVADAGLGEGLLVPMPLREGRVDGPPFAADLERDGDDGWWVGFHSYAGTPGFRFGDAACELEDFDPFHERTSTSPDSHFVRTLVVQQPHEDRIVSLRARTLFHDGPGVRNRRVLADLAEFAGALDACFGIDPAALGPERMTRLWERACAQHEARERQAENAA